MKENREKFKQFVTEQLKDYDEWREASPDGYAEIITDEAVKLFCQPAVMQQSEQLCQYEPDNTTAMNCKHCGDPKWVHKCCSLA